MLLNYYLYWSNIYNYKLVSEPIKRTDENAESVLGIENVFGADRAPWSDLGRDGGQTTAICG